MKTAYEIFMAIQEEECLNVNNFTLPEDYQIKAMIAYAEQFIDLAADEVWKISYSAERHYNKNKVLKLKELIK